LTANTCLPCHSPEVLTVGEAAGPAGFESITWSPTEIRRNADLKFKTYEQLVKRKYILFDQMTHVR
jgi:hypothetical protein